VGKFISWGDIQKGKGRGGGRGWEREQIKAERERLRDETKEWRSEERKVPVHLKIQKAAPMIGEVITDTRFIG